MNNSVTVSLNALETLAHRGDYQQAVNMLLAILRHLELNGLPLQTTGSEQEDDDQALQFLTRLAAAIAAILARKDLVLNDSFYQALMQNKRAMAIVFMGSGFRRLDLLLSSVCEYDSAGRLQIKTLNDLCKMFLVVTGKSATRNVPQLLSSVPGEVALPFWLSFFDSELCLSESESQARDSLIFSYDKIKDPVLSDAMLPSAINAWMHFSYVQHPDKHKAKQFLNRLLRNWGERQGLSDITVSGQGEVKAKPVLVVLSEHFKSGHAMFRCYRHRISSLKERFHTICIALGDTMDAETASCFNQVLRIERDTPITEIASIVDAQQPDVIYYPSLGMQTWTIVLAQFRLARVQCMTLGHPATSQSAVMDYVLVPEKNLPSEQSSSLFSEKLVLLRRNIHTAHPEMMNAAAKRNSKEKTRIAVNANVRKINKSLIAVCQSILEQAQKPVEFVFFPAVSGAAYHAFKREMLSQLPAVIYPKAGYLQYMEWLGSCDFALNPFPFGNTSGIVDCAYLGLPYVCLNGDEVHSHIDNVMSEYLELPDFCRATSVAGYTQAALRLLADDEERKAISTRLLGEKMVNKLLAPESEEDTGDFVDAVYHAFVNHHDIMASEDRVWSRRARQAV